MSEIEQLKKRIDNSEMDGIETAIVRDDYEPVGDMMIRRLLDSGGYITMRSPLRSSHSTWRIFKIGMEPY